LIEIRDLTVRYPNSPAPAVDALSLTIGAGEIFGFIGPNGAGKTSTLRVLAGLQRPQAGAVSLEGVDVIARPWRARYRVGYLPDFFGVYDELTCREYLDFFAAAQGLPRERREAVVPGALELVDLTGKADQLAGALSRGMQQRLGLARVLLHEPPILLLDEPASGLDPRARVEVREVLCELGRMGKTVILSAHVLADLAIACTSIGIMEQGRLVFAGPVRDALLRAGSPERVVLVACLEGHEAVGSALEAAEGLTGARLEAAGDLLRVTLPPDPAWGDGEAGRQAAVAAVGAALFGAGLRVSHLQAERADLERAFMTLTEGRLA